MKGVTTVACSDIGGGLNLASIDNRDYAEYTINIPVAGTYRLDFRVASNVSTGKFDFKKGQSVLANLSVPNTGGTQVWQTISSSVQLAAGSQKFRVAATASAFSLNWIGFELTLSAQGRIAASPYQDTDSGRIEMFPNPARNVLTIRADGIAKLKEIMIATETGVIATIQPNAEQITISTTDWKRGFYILRIKTDKCVEVRKLMIE
jgi:hypothetical protein